MRGNRSKRGFTLIELMITVAIAGTLASIAIPSFSALLMRAKQAERETLVRHLVRSVQLYFTTTQGDFFIATDLAPAGTLGPTKREFVTTGTDWAPFKSAINGHVYFQYRVIAWSIGASKGFQVSAHGDLDGNSEPSDFSEKWVLSNGEWTLGERRVNEGVY